MADISVQEDGGGDYTTLDSALDNVTVDPTTITISGEWDSDDQGGVCTVADNNVTITATGSSRHQGYRDDTGKRYRLVTNSNAHSITVNNTGCTIDGLVIVQSFDTTGSSQEGIRMANSGGTLTVENCIIQSEQSRSDQDGIYMWQSGTLNVENTYIYGFNRGGLHGQRYTGTPSQTWNVLSCGIWNCGDDGGLSDGGITDGDQSGGSADWNIFNTWVLDCSSSSASDYRLSQSDTVLISYSLDSDNSIASYADTGSTGNGANYNIADTTPQTGSYVIVNDISTAPYDLRLTDHADNDAINFHTDGSQHGLTIGNDIVGNQRPESGGTEYDVGPHEIQAAVAFTAELFPPKPKADTFSKSHYIVRT